MSTFTGNYHYGLGRRKASTATARLYKGKGSIVINNKPLKEYVADNTTLMFELEKPLKEVDMLKSFDISILVKGGGSSGQIGAAQLAISKALSEINDDVRSTLKKAGYLKRDSRVKERKKYGLRGARKKEQFSKR